MEWLEQRDKLHGAGPLNNAWKFIPGEAGAALLLMSETAARVLNLAPLGQVLGVGALTGNRIKTETVCIGEGHGRSIPRAVAALQVPRSAISTAT